MFLGQSLPKPPTTGNLETISSALDHVSLDFSDVRYVKGDMIGFALACFSLVPQCLLVMYATLILSRREAETILLFMGQVGNELVNHWLKNQIQQNRPTLQHGLGFGMPSAHAQFVSYYATFITLWILFRVRYNFSFTRKVTRVGSLIGLSLVVAYSRVYLHYHSGAQVLIGYVLGIVLAIGWFIVVCLLRDLGIIDLLLDTSIARWLYIKDTAAEKSSFVREEYMEWRRWRSKMKLLMKVQ
ncbi:hypothetical protein NADFUDRAFT_25397 [Nadsonia fulvescens var. elongata DSM 6958]|uniref:Dolichyldiphosphatase n=1 Tax=Nadsonia fulvescens var. elongata DSM 6958 TaxID=857566 RepID=A0A1E3PIU9_9ASCO|nr:hypothetical protein NADFUDRAFT_25397 [Nadsonia fulvescens var. elongata DSM 6958]